MGKIFSKCIEKSWYVWIYFVNVLGCSEKFWKEKIVFFGAKCVGEYVVCLVYVGIIKMRIKIKTKHIQFFWLLISTFLLFFPENKQKTGTIILSTNNQLIIKLENLFSNSSTSKQKARTG